jgi:hypothetical protein
VGVAVKLKMSLLGWTTTGRKGTVRGGELFAKAEHYRPGETGALDRARAALDAVGALGDEAERTTTGSELMDALRSAREAEGRVF